jgi:predicted TPR repeat methyltransferase
MTSVFLSSGDLLADRRASYAEMLRSAGDASAAADLMRQALERVPDWAAGHFRLGEMAEEAGELGAAAEAWREVLRLDTQDRFGAGLKLAALGLAPTPDAPPAAYVESLFDAYAPTFESALVEKLGYRVPGLIAEAVAAARPDAVFRHAVDLGCGTGLMGGYLRGRAHFLEGVDLSESMLQKAAEKRIYDRLERADINHLELRGPPADLVVAADVFVYLGALGTALANVAAMLEPGGLFVFSVERHEAAQDYVLGASLRFAHSPAYIRRILGESGFVVRGLAEAELRRDRDMPVPGLVVTAERGAKT